jgi:hypothetical protein
MELGKPIRTVVVEPVADPKHRPVRTPNAQPWPRPITPAR